MSGKQFTPDTEKLGQMPDCPARFAGHGSRRSRTYITLSLWESTGIDC